jgi:FkbH-like protein
MASESDQVTHPVPADHTDALEEIANVRRIFSDGDRTIAVAKAEKIAIANPNLAEGTALLIELLINSEQLTKAESVATVAMARFPDDHWIWHWSAYLAEKRSDHAIAFERWAHLAANSTSDDIRHGMIRSAARLQNFDLLNDVLAGRLGAAPGAQVAEFTYRTPRDLAVVPTVFRRGLVIGSCLTAALPVHFATNEPFCEADHILFNNAAMLPPSPPRPVADYDFQLVQMPLQALLPDGALFGLNHEKPSELTTIFDEACDRMTHILRAMLAWNIESGLTSFVTNFLVPQQNPLGRLLPRNDLRNMVYFIERLNSFLVEQIASYRNVYLLDLDQIAATIGRRYVQDDAVWVFSHGTPLSDFDHLQDQARLERLHPVLDYYPTRSDVFCHLIWREIEAMWRSIRQIDLVKMVLIDLDDTLWRGVLAETGTTDTTGWPKGLAEALLYLRRRGVILGIVSKNSEQRILDLWHHAFGSLLPIETFALRRINWAPKAENIAGLLQEANLLPRSVVFIDDNPVERAAVTAAFPDIRVLGANPYLLRRILLWSAETQVPVITTESATRGDMIRAQSERERTRSTLTRAEFLTSLGVRITLVEISSPGDARFPRAFELLNKTNQFNTTGRRWSSGDAERFFKDGGIFLAVEVADKFTRYGLVAVLCVTGDHIEQFVMSCRVVGLDVEPAVVAWLLAMLKGRGLTSVRADLVETEANLLSRDIWARTGFAPDGSGHFLHGLAVLPEIPDHVTVETVATQGDRRVGSAA